jgi:hypothetical protein
MAYTGDYIDSMDPLEPKPDEDISLGDDAIRQVKRVLQTIFPNAGQAADSDTYEGTFSQLDDLVAGAGIPKDTIVNWLLSSAVPGPPPGWSACDGTIRPGGEYAPDLQGRIIAGGIPGFLPPISDGGGSNPIKSDGQPTNSSSEGGNDSVEFTGQTTFGHNLTANEIPNLSNNIGLHMTAGTGTNSYSVAMGKASPIVDTTTATFTQTLNANSHSHNFSVDSGGGNENWPPYFSMLYIIKD